MREYKINNKLYRLNLFTSIQKNEAYLLGYLLGDGGYHSMTHKRLARMFVSSTEKYIVEFFKSTFCPDTTILSKVPVNKKRNIVSNKESHVLVFSSKFSEIFKLHGLLSLKTTRTFHNIPKNQFSIFLLGLFDADGNFSWGFRRDRNRLWAQFKITHPNLNMLKKLQVFLSKELGVSSFINPKAGENCYVLQVSSIAEVNKVLSYMYSNLPDVYNITKYNNYLTYIKV